MQPLWSSRTGRADDLGSLFLQVGASRPPHRRRASGEDATRRVRTSPKGRADDLGSLFLRVGAVRPPQHGHASGGDATEPVRSSPRGRADGLGSLLLRLGLGVVFARHGWLRFEGGVETYAAFLGSLDVPLPEVLAWLQVAAEGIGGLLLITGAYTRSVTLVLLATAIGTIWLVTVGFVVPGATGVELETALLAGLLGLLFIGPGRLSLDSKLGR